MTESSIFLSAGDPSGDNASAKMIEAIQNKQPDVKLFGLGGKRLKQLGQEQFAEPSQLAVIGFWEVAKHYFFFRKLFHHCLDEIKTRKPKVIILVDYPGFNLRLAKKLKGLDIPVVYYISPQIWAWGKKRIEQIKAYVDLVIPILPFEEKFYDDSGVNVRYVGHYLLEDIPNEYIASDIPAAGHLGLLPGSRIQEVQRMLPTMITTAKKIYEKHNIKAVIAGVSGLIEYERFLPENSEQFVSIVYNDARKVMYDSRFVITASGTATLETGIIGRPMVIVYKTGYLTYQIAKNLITLDTIGLINLVLGKKAVPELIQHDVNPQMLVHEIEKYMTDADYTQSVKKDLNEVVHLLGDGEASQKTAEIILEYL